MVYQMVYQMHQIQLLNFETNGLPDNCFEGASLVRILAISSSACVPGQKIPLQTESSPYTGTPVLDYIYTTIYLRTTS